VSGHSFVRKWVLLCAPADKNEEEVRFSLISTNQLLLSSFAVNQQKGVETAHLCSFFFSLRVKEDQKNHVVETRLL